MAYWLATAADQQEKAHLKRFDPRYWSVNFPRPMMASVVTTGAHSLRVDCVFYKANDLCGLIWEAEDRFDHPLLQYETSRDFRECKLSFHWQSGGIMPLDAINGPTLTIEGRDAGGVARTWYVRLWNYAIGSIENAQVSLDFGALIGGFTPTTNGEPVWAGDVDRMFVSLVPPGFTNSDVDLAAPANGWVELSNIYCDGPGSVLSVGDVLVSPHGLAIATGYDDSYNLTPERLLKNAFQLGYRGSLNHYVGMSHYFRLEPLGGGFYVSLTGGALNGPCAAWHADFAARAKAYGYSLITSLSYELFDAHCWNDWKQRTFAGEPALTGWVPPSTLLSPAHAGAMGYLQSVARAFVQIAVAAGHEPRFQIGEPWWWVTEDGRPCLYDDAAKAAFGGNPVNIGNVRSTSLTSAKKALLNDAGVLLANSTAALAGAVKLDHPTCETLLLVYMPTVLDESAPELKRANVPTGWAAPAYDVLQLEDYDWVITGNEGATDRGIMAIAERLNYALVTEHYFAGFVLTEANRPHWRLIDAAAIAARKRGAAETFVWALPQVLRDGYVHFAEGAAAMNAFDDVVFPIALGKEARVSPGFSTAIVTTASGHEQRNSAWAQGRMRFDAGTGVRSEADLQRLIAFFRARRGAAKAFRFRDPMDHSSNGMTGLAESTDQLVGVGDGVQTSFQLKKFYGDGPEAEARVITRPVPGSVLVAVNGATQASGWSLSAGGKVQFVTAPAAGAEISAGFIFDVPVRFADDSLDIDAVTFAAGDAPQVPLIEVREG